jgi:glyoxylase-like metal-dependent hydrolase (beta-lactamase superfamily II)
MDFNRRQMALGAAALSVSSAIVSPALAAAPFAGAQVPAVYRVKIGDIEVTALCDGYLNIPPALFPGATPELIAELSAAAYRPVGPMPTPVNAFIVNTGQRLYMIDAGTGNVRGPSLGHVFTGLKTAGIDPAQVDAVLMTHLHIDHAAGLTTADGKAAFPNAELLVAEAEAAFWLDPSLPGRATRMMEPSIKPATDAAKAYAGRISRFTPGKMVVPGIESVDIGGHTPGHCGFIIGTGADRLFIMADIVHVAAFQLARPELSIAFDIDPAAAAMSRKRNLDRAAADRLLIAGMHIPFPGIGRIAAVGSGYTFTADPWRPAM